MLNVKWKRVNLNFKPYRRRHGRKLCGNKFLHNQRTAGSSVDERAASMNTCKKTEAFRKRPEKSHAKIYYRPFAFLSCFNFSSPFYRLRQIALELEFYSSSSSPSGLLLLFRFCRRAHADGWKLVMTWESNKVLLNAHKFCGTAVWRFEEVCLSRVVIVRLIKLVNIQS